VPFTVAAHVVVPPLISVPLGQEAVTLVIVLLAAAVVTHICCPAAWPVFHENTFM
jgi:hypothetical protein